MLSKLQKPERDKRKRNDNVSTLTPKLPKVGMPDLQQPYELGNFPQGGSSSSTAPAPLGQPASLKRVISEFFLTNKLSGMDTHRLASGGVHSGATGVSKLAAAGNLGSNPKNLCRDIMRELVRGTSAPPLFWFPIPTWNPQTQSKDETNMPFLAIHQVLHQCKEKLDVALNTEAMTPALQALFFKVCRTLSLPATKTVSLGLHGDGVPYSKKAWYSLRGYDFSKCLFKFVSFMGRIPLKF